VTFSDWWDRHPLLTSWLAAAGFLGLFQAAFLLWRAESFGGGLPMFLGLASLGLMVGFFTFLVLLPVFFLLRRFHPAFRRDVHRASWSVCFSLAAGLTAWTLADRWASGPWIPTPLEPWFAAAWALIVGFAASWVRPARRWVRAGALAALVLLVLSLVPMGVGGGGPGSQSVEGGPEPKTVVLPGAQLPDVVLVSIDTLRADRLRAYGGSSSLTPEMDRVGDEGVLFERALASSPWTIPSVASMLTGLPTGRHGAGLPLSSGHTFNRSPLDGALTTLAERFVGAGYRTRAVVANGFLSPWSGMAQGFAEFANPFNLAGFAGMMRDLPLTRLVVALTPPEMWGDYRAEGVTGQALEWLAEEEDDPLFLWLHYIDPHTPFQADPTRLHTSALMEMAEQKQPEVLEDGTVVGELFVATDLVRAGTLWLGPDDRRRLEEYYDRAVRYMDGEIGRLFAALRERSAPRRVIAALTSDHGEEFWDHGQFEHGHDYYGEVTRIPLVFWGPGLIPEGRVVEELAGLVDVGPTLLELAGLEPPLAEAPDEGRSLVGSWSEEPGSEEWRPLPRFSEGNLYNLPAALMEDESWRYLLRGSGTEELYDAREDPEERHNLARVHPEIAERYRQVLEPRLKTFLETGGSEGPREVSPETLKALKALGYVQ
jgi:arylsulfatase A-like enzyme